MNYASFLKYAAIYGFAKAVVSVTISGTPGAGNVLTSALNSSLGTATTWQWERNGVNIVGATSSTYAQVSADTGTTVSVLINGLYVGSVSVPAIAAAFSAAPAVTSANTSGPVAWSAGTLSNAGTPAATITYNVFDNGTQVATNATSGVTYTPTVVGHTITVQEVATNAAGAPTSTSAGVVVTSAPPSFPTLTGTQKVILIGDSLQAFANYGQNLVSLANTAMARAADGSMTVTVSNQLYGLNTVYINNMTSDLDWERAGTNVFAAGSISIAASGMLPSSGSAVASPPGLTQPAANPGTQSTGRAASWDRHDTRGTWWAMQAALKGGLEFLGNFGHGGALAPAASQITYGMTFAPTLALYRFGINNAKSAQSSATAWAGIKADLDQISGLDGVTGVNHAPCMVCLVSPLGSTASGFANLNKNIIGEWNPAASGYVVGTINDLIYKYIQANPTKFLAVDEWTNAIDKVTDPSNWRMFDGTSTGHLNYTPDNTHWYPTLTRLNGRTAATALSPYYTPIDYLPRQSTDTFSVNGHARLIGGPRGPWFGSGTTAVGNTGGSGTVPTGWGAGRTVGSTSTIACSVLNPGDGKRLQVQAVITFGAANEEVCVWPFSSSGVTLASLGITAGTDSVDGAFALTYTGGGNVLGRVQMAIPSNVTAANYATFGETIETVAGSYPDAMTGEAIRTGWCKIAAGQTQFTPGILFRAVAAGTVTVIIELVDYKKR